MYEYSAKVINVIDGDTLKLDIDLGFGIKYYGQKVRLARINAPESKTHEGKVTKNILTQQLMNKTITIHTIKDKQEKYGRYLVEVFIDDEFKRKYNLNDWLVENNYAIKYE